VAKRIALVLLSVLAAASAAAGVLDVSVVDRTGRGVSDAVVTVDPIDAPRPVASAGTAIMDQKNLAFEPLILVVAVGTKVEFPNNDSVSHQVYSFSPAKSFQLPLYKGQVHPPVVFNDEGLVVLGCNIHDSMVGYIYVTAASFFGTTDAKGSIKLNGLATGDYRITVWSPWIADPSSTLVRTQHVDATGEATSSLHLNSALRSHPEPRPRRSDWEY
jgi:plastocyanin